MFNRPTAVVADDNATFLMYFSTLLSRMNFEVMPVRSGEEAFDLARIVTPRLIALDVLMPGQTGLDTLRRIREDQLLAKTPVIMLSGSSRYADECRAVGCCDYLTKPVDLHNLHHALQACHPKEGGKRQHLRAPFNRSISYCVDGTHRTAYAVTLSEGGIYLRASRPLPVGTRVEIDLPLGKKESMVVCGRVIYTMNLLKGAFTLPPGMAVRFEDGQPDMQKRLREEVVRLLAGDILEEQEEELIRAG